MSTLICCGINRPELISLLVQEQVAGLVSTHCVGQSALWLPIIEDLPASL